MPSRPNWKRFVAWMLVATSAFVIAYEIYAHVAAATVQRENKLASFEERLDSANSLARFAMTSTGGLRYGIENEGLHIFGRAATEQAAVILEGPEQRLDDVVTVSVRAKLEGPETTSIQLGIETADGTRRVVLATYGNDPDSLFAIEGDVDPKGVRRQSTVSAGIESKWMPGWHTLALRFEAYDRLLLGRCDDRPVASAETQWKMGTKVRFFLAVAPRKPDTAVDVLLRDASYDRAPRPATLVPFVERFKAPVLDTRRWSVLLGDEQLVHVSTKLDPNAGLVVNAKSNGNRAFVSALTLLTPPTPLETFDLRAKVEIRKLQRATIVIGVLATGYSGTRFLDVGRSGRGEQLAAILAGHALGNGQVAFVEQPAPPGNGDIEIRFDALTGRVRTDASSPLAREPFDLLPGEEVQLRFAINLDGPDAEADVVVHEIAYDR